LELVEGRGGLFDDRTGYVVREAVPNDVAGSFGDDRSYPAQNPEVLARCRAIAADNVGEIACCEGRVPESSHDLDSVRVA